MAKKRYYVVIEADTVGTLDPDFTEVASEIDEAIGGTKSIDITDVTVYGSLKDMVVGEMPEED